MVAPLLPFTANSFPAVPALDCDIIMKGGITSGVVYPHAVCELAQTYRLRSIGGASAGAIAAAVAACAELGRQSGATGVGSGFLGLAGFPNKLSELQPDNRSRLFHLFQPRPEARRLFSLFTDALDELEAAPPASTADLAIHVFGRCLHAYPLRSGVGALSGAIALPSRTGIAALSLTGILVGIVSGILADLAELPDGGFGLSRGMGEVEGDPALTPWLHEQTQLLAGRTMADKPVTFGDLDAAGIELKVMTTNLSRSQPLAMPWVNDMYWFRRDDFTLLFPDQVVKHLLANPPPLPRAAKKRRETQVFRAHMQQCGFFPLPRAEHLPIIVATRMSLSFPILISAVPLYAVDFSLPVNQDYRKAVRSWYQQNPDGILQDHIDGVPLSPRPQRNWFSDGGLTANLPLSFFDSPLPTRPTFAIDLAAFGPGQQECADEEKNVYLPEVNQGGLHRRTADWSDKSGLRLLTAFATSLFTTARVWVDEAQLVMPGYRDRIVTVYQTSAEGGLNLTMDAKTVTRLSKRGRYAARHLIDRFDPAEAAGAPTGFDNHRWIRLRTAASGLSDWLGGFERGYTAAPDFYDGMLSSASSQPSYKIRGRRLASAFDRMQGVLRQASEWEGPPPDAFTHNTPRPLALLRLVPGNPRTDDHR